MENPTPTSDKTELIEPAKKDGAVCPRCSADPMVLWNKQIIDEQGLVLLLATCQACRVVLSVAPLARIDTRGGRIIRPS